MKYKHVKKKCPWKQANNRCKVIHPDYCSVEKCAIWYFLIELEKDFTVEAENR